MMSFAVKRKQAPKAQMSATPLSALGQAATRYLAILLILSSFSSPLFGSEERSKLTCGETLSTTKKLFEIRVKSVETSDDNLIDGKIFGDYDDYFYEGLDKKSFEAFANARRTLGLSVNLCDLFGSAVFTNNPKVFDSLTGVRLGPLEKSQIPNDIRRHQNWRELAGNIYERKTWDQIDESMKDRLFSKFDMIVVKPEGALRNASETAFEAPLNKFKLTIVDSAGRVISNYNPEDTHERLNFRREVFLSSSLILLNRAWRRLSGRNGIFLFQVTFDILSSSEFQKWRDILSNHGQRVDVFFGLRNTPYVRMIKTKSSPANLEL